MSDLNREKYREFSNKQPGLPIFYKAEWLDAVCGSEGWSAYFFEIDGQIRAIFPYQKICFLGKSVYKMPKLTPYLGVLFFVPDELVKTESVQSFKKQATRHILSQVGNPLYFHMAFHPDFDDWQVFHWSGYYQHCRYTYRIDTSQGSEKIWDGFNSKIRNHIRTAERMLKISVSDDVETLYRLNQTTFKRQNLLVPYRKEVLERIVNKFYPSDDCRILVAKNKLNDDPVAALMAVNDCEYMYSLVAAMSDEAARGSVSLLIWRAIQIAEEKSVQFDFEGSDIPNIEKFFRAFGGKLTTYYQIYKSWNKLTDALLFLSSKFK